jgi:hypothetical protein
LYGEVLSRNEILDFLLGPDPTMDLHETQALDRAGHTYLALVYISYCGSRCVLNALNISDNNETNMIKSSQCVGIVQYLPDAFEDIGIFEDGFKSLTILRCSTEA